MLNDDDDPPLTPKQLKALFREWTADYAAAAERDRNQPPPAAPVQPAKGDKRDDDRGRER